METSTMTEDMLTAMARAQQDALSEIFAGQKAWDDLSMPEQAARVVGMRAAVAVQREPNEAMAGAGRSVDMAFKAGNYVKVWQTMIDAMEGE